MRCACLHLCPLVVRAVLVVLAALVVLVLIEPWYLRLCTRECWLEKVGEG